MRTPTGEPTTLRSVALHAYAPATLYAVGSGAVAPAVALLARELGASVGVAGLVVSLLAVGQVLGDVPAGAIAARAGEQRAMLGAVALSCLALGGCLLAPGVAQLCVAVFVLGLANSVFGLARQTYLTEVVPVHLRARALSTLGGTMRIGMFVGPFLAAPVVATTGPRGAFWVHLVAGAVTVVLLLALGDPVGRQGARPAPVRARDLVRRNARVLGTLGGAALLIGAVRASRQVVVPLWADHLGLDPAVTSIVYGLSGAMDMLLFYPSGRVMDLRGRVWVAVPSMAVIGVAHLLLPLTTSAVPLVAVAMLLGVGNGMGAGVVMTLGADVSPVRGRAQFLGIWRLFHDSGSAAGPLLLSGTAAAVALGPAVAVLGGVALGAAGLLAVWIPRFSTPADD